MPRLMLDEDEVQIIERHRAKTAEARAFNAGLDRAREVFQAWVEHPDSNSTAFHEAIQSERKSTR